MRHAPARSGLRSPTGTRLTIPLQESVATGRPPLCHASFSRRPPGSQGELRLDKSRNVFHEPCSRLLKKENDQGRLRTLPLPTPLRSPWRGARHSASARPHSQQALPSKSALTANIVARRLLLSGSCMKHASSRNSSVHFLASWWRAQEFQLPRCSRPSAERRQQSDGFLPSLGTAIF